MSGELEIRDIDLHALIDGALDAERSSGLEARIDSDPTLAQRVAAFRSDKEMLGRVYAPLSERPIPKEWLALAHGSVVAAPPAISWRLIGAIAATLVLGMVGTVTYLESRPPQGSEIVQVALDARGPAAQAGKLIAVAAGADARKYDSVLSATVASNVKVPDMGRLGYQLAGIRLYPNSSGGGAAELLYRDNNSRLFTLYLRRSGGGARFDQFERDGLRVCVWQDEELSTVMAGNVSTAAMQRLASLAYSGLTL